jgi:uncharacterized membrane protein
MNTTLIKEQTTIFLKSIYGNNPILLGIIISVIFTLLIFFLVGGRKK